MFERMINHCLKTGENTKQIKELLYHGTPGEEENMYYELLDVKRKIQGNKYPFIAPEAEEMMHEIFTF